MRKTGIGWCMLKKIKYSRVCVFRNTLACFAFGLAWVCSNIASTARAVEYSYSPGQYTSLKAKLNNQLQPGDVVMLEDGTYSDFQVSFIANGTADRPITLKARNEGGVVLTGKLNVKISGHYLIVDGLILKDGEAASGDIVEFRSSSSSFANHCRLTNCVIDNCNNPDEKYRNSTSYSERWVMMYGRNNRVDHCYFTNKINGGVLLMVSLSDSKSRENTHLVDHNFFGYREKFSPGNNAETIRIGDSSTSQYSSQTSITKNFFYRCDGESEIISIKSCDNVIEENTVYESQGGVVCRHGHRNVIRNNFFIGNNVSNCAGIRVINEGHRIYGNFFQEIIGAKSRASLCIMSAIFETPDASTHTDKEPLNAYHRVKDVDIYENTFVNCTSSDWGTATSYTYSGDNPFYPGKKVEGTLYPENCRLYNNVFYNPQVNTMLTKTGNVSGIVPANNLYCFKKTETTSGFVSSAMSYEKIADGSGKGLYRRSDGGEALWPDAAVPAKCGTPWYPLQENDRKAIAEKTIFPDLTSSIAVEKAATPSFSIRREGDSRLQVSSSNAIRDIRVYSMQGLLLHCQEIAACFSSFHFPYAAGLYIVVVGFDSFGECRRRLFV